MFFTIFTILTGFASLVGLALQILDVFPKHREVRQKIALVTFGVFIGAIFGGLSKSSITFSFEYSGFALLNTAIISILILLLISGSLSSDAKRRGDIFTMAGLTGGLLLLVLFFGFLFLTATYDSKDSAISTDEYIVLSKQAERLENYDRAIMYLEKIDMRISSTDPRKTDLKNKIESLKKKQIQ
jgi:hypothetical protein